MRNLFLKIIKLSRPKYVSSLPVIVFILTALLASCSGSSVHEHNRTSAYMYEDTIQLVGLVEDAAALLEKEGDKAFAEFGRKNSKWFNEKWYLFVYDINGTCLFHPVDPHLVGLNIMNMADINGKPVIRMITDVGRKKEKDAFGWVFYHWVDRTQFDPIWKASYIRKVIDSNNRLYIIGSGLNGIKVEKVFVMENVDNAVDLIKEKGKDFSFKTFCDPASAFSFFDTYIFIVDSSGKILVDPAFPGLSERNMMFFKDAVGREIVKDLMDKLKGSENVWIQYMWPKPGETLPSRKLLYCRKLNLGAETLYVCSDFFLATPIWMRL
jgi:signal transduction histidine kinase